MKIHDVRRHLAAVLAVTALAAGLAGCGAGAEASGSQATTIRYQSYIGIVDPTELADALGYFKDSGVKLKRLGDVQGGPESLRAVATGQVDYGGAFNGAIAKLASTGAPIQAVVSYYGSNDTVNSSVLVKSDSGIKTAKDLIGKKIAVNTLGANAEAVIDTYLKKEGLTPTEIKKVTLIPLPGINTEAALRNGQVDAGYLFGALKEAAISHGGVSTLVTDSELVGPYNGGSYVLTKKFIAENPKGAKAFVSGVAKAIDYAQTHPLEDVKKIVIKYSVEHGRPDQAKALANWKGLGVSSKGGTISNQDFNLWLTWLDDHGDIKSGTLSAKDVYTNELNPFAKGV